MYQSTTCYIGTIFVFISTIVRTSTWHREPRSISNYINVYMKELEVNPAWKRCRRLPAKGSRPVSFLLCNLENKKVVPSNARHARGCVSHPVCHSTCCPVALPLCSTIYQSFRTRTADEQIWMSHLRKVQIRATSPCPIAVQLESAS
jgi:hypothetical protein